MPTRPMAYTVAVPSHQKASGDAAWSKPTTTPHIAGVRMDGLVETGGRRGSGAAVEDTRALAVERRVPELQPERGEAVRPADPPARHCPDVGAAETVPLGLELVSRVALEDRRLGLGIDLPQPHAEHVERGGGVHQVRLGPPLARDRRVEVQGDRLLHGAPPRLWLERGV